MCTMKTWYSGADGFIRQCKECGSYQVVFGTTVFTLDEECFKAFVLHVHELQETLVSIDEDLRCILVPLTASTVSLILSEKELKRLDAMLQITDNEVITSGLLELFG
jgi:hypothetical protein